MGVLLLMFLVVSVLVLVILVISVDRLKCDSDGVGFLVLLKVSVVLYRFIVWLIELISLGVVWCMVGFLLVFSWLVKICVVVRILCRLWLIWVMVCFSCVSCVFCFSVDVIVVCIVVSEVLVCCSFVSWVEGVMISCVFLGVLVQVVMWLMMWWIGISNMCCVVMFSKSVVRIENVVEISSRCRL